ncbi:ABC transporter permease [Phenylobacterium sp.]|uniref:ABC transporter permease n=1 Tax=Phenylobacterium sp. TaxID=1871053 RepID=UPI0035B35866
MSVTTASEDHGAELAPLINPPVVDITPNKGLLDLDLGSVWRYRELLVVLITRDIQVLYKQAALGAAWAVVQPLFAVAVFTIIFGHFAKMPTDGIPYPVFAFAGVLPWTYFSEAVRRAATGLVNDSELVRKVYFPRLLVPLSNVITPLVDFAIAFVILICMMLWFHMPITWRLLVIPPLMMVAMMLALAVSLWLGPINVRFRDIKHTLPFILQIWMYGSPIVYSISMVPDQWKLLYSLNPMVGVIEGFRWAVFNRGAPDFSVTAVSAVAIALLLFGGLVFFKRMERSFADMI